MLANLQGAIDGAYESTQAAISYYRHSVWEDFATFKLFPLVNKVAWEDWQVANEIEAVMERSFFEQSKKRIGNQAAARLVDSIDWELIAKIIVTDAKAKQ